jgi:hypothetical protein
MTMINLKNYEEWFLLYADNELTASEKESVMAFIDLHPDLRQEMDLFLSLKCFPDQRINFPEKEILYLPEESDAAPITFSPDLTIVFPDKSSLYRQVQVQKMNWLKPLSVAASLFFMIGLMWWIMKMNGGHEIEKGNINLTGIAGAIQINENKPSPVSGIEIASKKVIAVSANKVKSVATNFVYKPQQTVLPTDANKEVATVYHSPEPAVELFSETPAITAQTNFSPAALEAARARANANLVAEPIQTESGLSEAAKVNTALLIEDANKEDDQNIFRGIIRRINRVIQDDTEEPERKFIQVANFQIPVKQ